ncbi:hypothetical protein HNQ08_003114 [Deinococcus humi]|uniref:Uncharacterized protein n=1 Tax=Deinococcus humi TaxID=662880 RepID=A0A7W8NHH2_9DEIO|nr:hypothetical protein [Deinococcus humi]
MNSVLTPQTKETPLCAGRNSYAGSVVFNHNISNQGDVDAINPQAITYDNWQDVRAGLLLELPEQPFNLLALFLRSSALNNTAIA